MRASRPVRLALLLSLAIVAGAWLARERGVRLRAPVPRARPALDTIVLVVLDTVRADRTSLCGAARPTTPALAALAARPGAWSTCKAVAPASWTLPSHATFFTGLPPWEHRADFSAEAERVGWLAVRPLPTQPQTLAEELVTRGYQAVLVSANPTLGLPLGLDRGFAVKRVADRRGGSAEWLGEALDDALAEPRVYRARGLFLVVNIFDAHDPWPATDPTWTWLPQRPAFEYGDPASLRYIRGSMSEDEATAWVEHLRDSYDGGLRRADQALEQTLDLLARRGWLDGPSRVVVTSDHGEMLGEREAYGHGGWVSEAITHVPLVTLGLPPCEGEWVSLGVVHGLLRDGRCAPAEGPAIATSAPNADLAKLSEGRHDGARAIGAWAGSAMVEARTDERRAWVAGSLETLPLAAVPADLASAVDRVEQALERPAPAVEAGGAAGAEVEAGLRALGYVE